MKHEVKIEVQAQTMTTHEKHRWHCCCGRMGDWKRTAHDAQMGGQFHVQRTKA